MNYIIESFTEKVKSNIESGIYTKLSLVDGKIVMFDSYVFLGIVFPTEEIRENVIVSFNESEFAKEKKIRISTYSKRIVAYFE